MRSPNTRALKALAALSTFVAQGCAELIQPAPRTETAPPFPPPPAHEAVASPAKVYGCASIRSSSKGRPPPVTLEALRMAVDSPDAATTTALLRQLGKAEVREDGSQVGIYQHRYFELGLQLDVARLGDQPIIKSIELLGGTFRPTWAGALPDDLSFAMSTRDTFSALGLPDEKRLRTYAATPHYYRTRGLTVSFDTDGCLLGVGLVARIAPRKMRFDDLVSITNKTERGFTGIHVGFTRALGDFGDPSAPMTVALELYDEKGQPVQGLDAQGNAAGPLRVEQADFASGEIRRSFFVPFASMRLPPGPRAVRAELSARAKDARGAVTPIEAEVGGSLPVSFEMPLLRRARLGVLSAEVTKGVYDNGFMSSRSAAPDLRWSIWRTIQGVVSGFQSTTRQDVFSASWSEQTPWMVVAQNDHLTLCVEDEDVLAAETIGCVSVTLDDAISSAKQRTPLSGRGVTRLLLAPPQVSAIPKH